MASSLYLSPDFFPSFVSLPWGLDQGSQISGKLSFWYFTKFGFGIGLSRKGRRRVRNAKRAVVGAHLVAFSMGWLWRYWPHVGLYWTSTPDQGSWLYCQWPCFWWKTLWTVMMLAVAVVLLFWLRSWGFNQILCRSSGFVVVHVCTFNLENLSFGICLVVRKMKKSTRIWHIESSVSVVFVVLGRMNTLASIWLLGSISHELQREKETGGRGGRESLSHFEYKW